MNVVSKVGSFITQGVYSVATPFHPFGGAVDIIVVEQEDGSYRSTPWYVRFGKFQGVLKRAEKIVHISVNGTEADFHMYLDNSGEAYFVREEPLEEGKEPADENRNSQENEELFEFHDGNSAETTEFSYSYENINEVHDLIESSQDSKSEVVLFSVDGHVLTAPISSSEEAVENVELTTPQFHLGPVGESDDWGENLFHDTLIEEITGSEVFAACEEPMDPSINAKTGDSPGFDSSDEPISQGTQHEDSINTFVSLSPSPNFDSSNEPINGTLELVDSADISLSIASSPASDSSEEPINGRLKVEDSTDISLSLASSPASDSSNAPINGRLELDPSVDTAVSLSPFPDLDPSNESVNGRFELQNFVDISVSLPPSLDFDSSDKPTNRIIQLEDSVDTSVSLSSSRAFDSLNEPINGNLQLENSVDTSVSPSPSSDFDPSNEPINGGPQLEDSVDTSIPLSPSMDQVIASDVKKADGDSKILSMHIESHEERLVIQNLESTQGSVSVSLESLEVNMDVKYEQMGSIQERSSIEEIQVKEESMFRMGFEISLCGNLMRSGMSRKSAEDVFNAHRISREEFESSSQSILKNKNLIVRFRDKYLTWDTAAPIILGKVVFDLDMPLDPKSCIFIEEDGSPESIPSPSTLTMSPSSRRWRLWPIRRVKTLQHTDSSSSSEDVFLDSDSFLQSPRSDSLASNRLNGGQSPGKRFIRTNSPTTKQIASLNLKDGQNTIAFSFSTRVLGRQQVDAHIYLWKWNARIVISDVDGTITKSDVLGQFMPLVGRDWTQSGVARLFSAIKENGYQLLFLSARAIVQAYLTRSFLLNLKQDGKALPNGPVVISPDGLFPSLYREVIRRTPHEFKIACLEGIRALFPSDYNPFYAGFGNRDTDELSYRKIGIPKGKVFIINPKGEVAVNHSIDVKSYTSLHTLVNDMFPPTSVVEQEDFNSWNYWKMPLPSVDC